MGQDKLALLVDGKPLHQAAATSLEECCDELLQVGRDLHLKNFRYVADMESGQGPLAGIISAFAASRSDWVVALAGDLPCIDKQLIQNIIAACRTAPTEILAVVVKSKKGLEPLCAAYRTSLHETAMRSYARGERSIYRFLKTLTQQVQLLPITEDLENTLLNLNSPEDYQRFAGTSLDD